ncbi:hypothetical protein PGTUg99_037251 [Puccinia graminis f. sp. tritici]|nr:hypothetical protein PGTUg99_037251 [Puccinia graminis f. sp. tritici]
MVHKAPAAFGMVAVLLAEGLSTGAVRRILLAFSLAAPMGALTTWTGLALVDRLTGRPADLPEKAEDAFQWWIGVTLLFSAGTFLFVATHALQNTSSNPVDPCCPQIPANPSPSTHLDPELPSHHLHLPARSPPSPSSSSSQVSVSPLLTCCLMASGMCFPWLLTLLVGSHHH